MRHALGLIGAPLAWFAIACGGGKPIEAAPPAPTAAAVIWHDPSQHSVTFVTVAQGVRIEVLDWGGDGEPLIFLNGLENTGHIFDNFAPRLGRVGSSAEWLFDPGAGRGRARSAGYVAHCAGGLRGPLHRRPGADVAGRRVSGAGR